MSRSSTTRRPSSRCALPWPRRGSPASAFGTEVTVGTVVGDFVWASLGGVAVGLGIAVVVSVLRKHFTTEPAFDTVLSFMVPFAAYVPAEELHASGVIAVVTAGLVLGHKSPRTQSAASRLSERINWSSIQFLLENAVFLLIGLQVFYVIDRVRASELSAGQITFAALGTLVVVLVLRPIWVFPFRLFTTRVLRREAPAPWTHTAVLSWAGMRGVVTLAAALLLPTDTPYRDVLVLIAVVVTVGTLLIQGTTLPGLARRLGVRGPDPREDALQAATVLAAASRAGLAELAATPDLDDDTRALLTSRSEDRVNQMWERLGARGAGVDETPERPLPPRPAGDAAGRAHGGAAAARRGARRPRGAARRAQRARPRGDDARPDRRPGRTPGRQ